MLVLPKNCNVDKDCHFDEQNAEHVSACIDLKERSYEWCCVCVGFTCDACKAADFAPNFSSNMSANAMTNNLELIRCLLVVALARKYVEVNHTEPPAVDNTMSLNLSLCLKIPTFCFAVKFGSITAYFWNVCTG